MSFRTAAHRFLPIRRLPLTAAPRIAPNRCARETRYLHAQSACQRNPLHLVANFQPPGFRRASRVAGKRHRSRRWRSHLQSLEIAEPRAVPVTTPLPTRRGDAARRGTAMPRDAALRHRRGVRGDARAAAFSGARAHGAHRPGHAGTRRQEALAAPILARIGLTPEAARRKQRVRHGADARDGDGASLRRAARRACLTAPYELTGV